MKIHDFKKIEKMKKLLLAALLLPAALMSCKRDEPLYPIHKGIPVDTGQFHAPIGNSVITVSKSAGSTSDTTNKVDLHVPTDGIILLRVDISAENKEIKKLPITASIAFSDAANVSSVITELRLLDSAGKQIESQVVSINTVSSAGTSLAGHVDPMSTIVTFANVNDYFKGRQTHHYTIVGRAAALAGNFKPGTNVAVVYGRHRCYPGWKAEQYV